MPYHSPYGPDHLGGGEHGWNHSGHHHDHDNDHHHNHFGFYTYYGVGYPFWPWWGWGYPYVPNYWSYSDDYDSQPASNYAASQPYPDYSSGPYQAPPEQAEPDAEPDQEPSYTPWPYSRPAPSNYQPQAPQPSSATTPDAPVTLVFKDGRPNEQIHNYMLTAHTLTVLDPRRRDVPVDQIDLAATARVNREAGVDFALPSGSH
jgi:hypothetical protein